MCETVTGKRLDKSSFRRRLRDEKNLGKLRGELEGGANRPAQLYRAISGFRFEMDSESPV